MTPAPTIPDLLTLDQVAAKIQIAKSTAELWVYQGDLASFKKGAVRRVSPEALARFIILNTLKPRRPDWLTAPIESEFRRQVRAGMATSAELDALRCQVAELERALATMATLKAA